MKISISWLDLLIGAFFGFFFGYLALAFFTDLRIDTLRKYLNANAIKVGTQACAEEYERRYLQNEHLAVMKRKKRDAALREYGKRLNNILEVE